MHVGSRRSVVLLDHEFDLVAFGVQSTLGALVDDDPDHAVVLDLDPTFSRRRTAVGSQSTKRWQSHSRHDQSG